MKFEMPILACVCVCGARLRVEIPVDLKSGLNANGEAE